MFLYILFFAVTVFLPILLWLLFILWEDRSEPEPGRLIRQTMYVGFSAVAFASFANVLVMIVFGLPLNMLEAHSTPSLKHLAVLAVFLAGPIEELIKYIVLRYSVYTAREFNQVFDGIVYGIIVALVFSLVENIGYYQMIQANFSTLAFVIGVMYRSIFTTLLHVTATGIAGYYVGRAKFDPANSTKLLVQGLVYASLLHGSFNLLVSGVVPFGDVLANVLLFASFVWLARLWSKPEVRMIWKQGVAVMPALAPRPAPAITPRT